jgi:hypothetical protein
MEFASITEKMVAPAVVSKPLTAAEDIANEAAKRKAFSAPMVLPQDQAFATGQIETVDEHREKYNTGMGNVTPDSGLSVPIDRRGWLPDTPAKELTPSR